jgi:RNA polymerase sigma-70 factor (ECF subfamily)
MGGPAVSHPGADLQISLEARERAEHLWRAIDALSEKLRIVIVLAGIHGHDVKEVSALLELPEGTVKSRLFAARQHLREALAWMADTRPKA